MTASQDQARESRAGPKANRAPGISVVILTRNEEINIEACLRTLGFSDDIVILDSESTDRTVEIAQTFPNVRIYTRHFDTEHKQRNHSLHELHFEHDWVYICDADERVPNDLAQELLAVAKDPASPHAAYRMRYKNMFMGRWIKRSSSYPVWLIRLVRPERVRYEQRETNVHPIVDGTVGSLKAHFRHYSFNTGLRRWFDKHNYYSDQEAVEAVRVRGEGWPPLGSFFANDPIQRRRAVKNASFKLPFRSLLRFLHSYVLGLGFLEGKAGWHYAHMISTYEYWLTLKAAEHRRNWESQTRRVAQQMLERGK